MPILLTLLIGGLAGILASHFMRLDASLPASISIGVIGAILGFFTLRGLLSLFAAGSNVLSIFIGGLFGAVVLILIYRKIRR